MPEFTPIFIESSHFSIEQGSIHSSQLAQISCFDCFYQLEERSITGLYGSSDIRLGVKNANFVWYRVRKPIDGQCRLKAGVLNRQSKFNFNNLAIETDI